MEIEIFLSCPLAHCDEVLKIIGFLHNHMDDLTVGLKDIKTQKWLLTEKVLKLVELHSEL